MSEHAVRGRRWTYARACVYRLKRLVQDSRAEPAEGHTRKASDDKETVSHTLTSIWSIAASVSFLTLEADSLFDVTISLTSSSKA